MKEGDAQAAKASMESEGFLLWKFFHLSLKTFPHYTPTHVGLLFKTLRNSS